MTKRKRPTYSAQFRAEAVKLVVDQQISIGDASQDLGISNSCLRKWVKQARIDGGQGPANALTTDEVNELRRLRKEVKTLRMEREILKKATAFFAKESR